MKKAKLMLLLIVSIVAITGCSNSKASYSVDGTNIIYNGKALEYLSEYDGTTGIYGSEDDLYDITYQVCSAQEMKDCPDNKQEVHEDDITPLNKGGYFLGFLGSYSVLYIGLSEGGNKEAISNTEDKETAPIENIINTVYTTLESLNFEPIETATFKDKVVVNANGKPLVLRNNSIVIPGVLVVSQGSKNGTQQVTVGEITVMLYETQGYKFYQYGDCLVKIVNSANIEDYVTFI